MAENAEAVLPAATDPAKGLVRIYGPNMFMGPLFESSDARTIVMYDGDGTPCVILARLVDNTWAMGTSRDSDWDAVKKRFGVEPA